MKKILIIVTFVVFAISSVYSQKDSVIVGNSEGPYIQFQTLSHNFGELEFAEDATFEFSFSNIGNDTLIISDVKSSCGCTVPEWSTEPIAPGARGVITVQYDSHRSGEFEKGITVYSNASNGDIVLRIEGLVKQNMNKPVLGEKKF